MRKVLSFIALIILYNVAFGQSPSNKNNSKLNGAYIVVADTINLGEIYVDELSDEHGKIKISVKNNGSKPLILKSVQGCCGTNVKQWPKAPILPGKESFINVEFRTEPRPQKISRTITIESNASNNKMVKVAITGIVIQKKGKNELSI